MHLPIKIGTGKQNSTDIHMISEYGHSLQHKQGTENKILGCVCSTKAKIQSSKDAIKQQGHFMCFTVRGFCFQRLIVQITLKLMGIARLSFLHGICILSENLKTLYYPQFKK